MANDQRLPRDNQNYEPESPLFEVAPCIYTNYMNIGGFRAFDYLLWTAHYPTRVHWFYKVAE